MERLKKIINFHVGCSYAKDDILQRMHAGGINVCILDDIGIKPEQPVSFDYLCIKGLSVNAIADLINDYVAKHAMELGNVFTLADGSVDKLNLVLHQLKLDPVSRYETTFLRNKFKVRQLLEGKKSNVGFFKLVKNEQEIPVLPAHLFPVIVKPTESMESRGVRKAMNQEELVAACKYIFYENKTFIQTDLGEIILEEAYHQENSALIESVMVGEKYSLEVIVEKGQLIFFSATWSFDGSNSFFYQRADVVGSQILNEDLRKKAEELILDVIQSLKFVTTVLHIEVFLTPEKEFKIIEVNSRLVGGQIPELLSLSFGQDFAYVSLYRQLLGKDPADFNKASSSAYYGYEFLTQDSGRFQVLADSVLGEKIRWYYDDGDTINRLKTSLFTRVGLVIGKAKGDTLVETLEEIQSKEQDLFSVL